MTWCKADFMFYHSLADALWIRVVPLRSQAVPQVVLVPYPLPLQPRRHRAAPAVPPSAVIPQAVFSVAVEPPAVAHYAAAAAETAPAAQR